MSALLNILKNQKGPATTTTFTALPPIVIDEDSPHHNLIKTLFGHMLGDQLQDSKKLEDMTIEELEKAKEKALADNKFEEAAKIRDLIEQKKK